MLAVTAAVILHETRGTTLWTDEWTWALDRRNDGLGTLLEPHNGHFSLVPLLLYRALFATVGIDDYVPYRVMVVIGHLGCAGLLFAYARRRIGPLAALLPTAVLLMLGPAWQNFLWPFQIAWLISLAAGLGALLALDRGDRRGDAVACALLALALASSGIGIAIARGPRGRGAVAPPPGCGSSRRRSRSTRCGGSSTRTRTSGATTSSSRRSSPPTRPAARSRSSPG